MAKGVVSWSQTAANNDDASSAVNYAEGQAPSTLNDAGRGLMADVALYRDDTAGSLETGGTTTAYTLTSNQVFPSLPAMNGQELTVRFNAANGASPTLNVDTLGAKAIRINASTAVPTGFIAAGSIWRITYDNSIPAFILNGVSQVQNVTSLTASGTVTGGDLVATDDLTVVDDASVGGNLTVDTDVTVGDDLTVTDDASVGGNLTVTGTGAFTGKLTANNSGGVTAYNSAKAYATFTLSGTTVTSSSSKRFNISDVTRTGVGVFTVTFANALPTANYIVVGVYNSNTTNSSAFASSRTTADFSLRCANTNGSTVEPDTVDLVVLGF